MNDPQFCVINPIDHKKTALYLLQHLNPSMSPNLIENHLSAMADMPNYTCFGLFLDNKMVGISSGWITVRIYCGKQLEIDNVVIDPNHQSKGLGAFFMNAIKQWSAQKNFTAIGLNTYVQNTPSHKFYFNHGFGIIGYHFEHTLKALT